MNNSNKNVTVTQILPKPLSKAVYRNISIVDKLKEYLSRQDPKRAGTLGDRIVEKYYKMAREGDPIIMRDLINRIDGLPKQIIASDKDNPVNINIIASLFGKSVRKNSTTIDYDTLNPTNTDKDTH